MIQEAFYTGSDVNENISFLKYKFRTIDNDRLKRALQMAKAGDQVYLSIKTYKKSENTSLVVTLRDVCISIGKLVGMESYDVQRILLDIAYDRGLGKDESKKITFNGKDYFRHMDKGLRIHYMSDKDLEQLIVLAKDVLMEVEKEGTDGKES